MSILTEIERLEGAKVSLKSSIENKGVAVSDSARLDEYPALVDSIPVGGDSKLVKDINFYDYDGTVLHSYTKAEFLALSSMPENPSHEGLTAQGWNWSFEDAQEYVGKYGMLEIGQMYVTEDGKTRLYITIEEEAASYAVGMNNGQSAANGIVVNWGDGSDETTVPQAGNDRQFLHTYESPGDYVITIEAKPNVTWSLGQHSTYSFARCVRKVELGEGIINLVNSFANAKLLETITTSNGLLSISGTCFKSANRLIHFTFPASVTTYEGSFQDASGLRSLSLNNGVRFSSSAALLYSDQTINRYTLPEGAGTPNYGISLYCSNIRRCAIGEGLTALANSCFIGCSQLTKLVIPSTVTSVGSTVFQNCSSLKEVTFRSVIVPNLTAANFGGGFPNTCIIYVPAESVEAYKTATNWSNYASRIQAIPE